MGYHRAGFDVVGFDLNPQSNYPFEFIQADALEILRSLVTLGAWFRGRRVEVIHTSPPCQASTALTKGTNKGREYPQLIPPTRELLQKLDVPSVIENVQGAAVRRDVTLCGEMFGLAVIRHRYFEIHNATVERPVHKPHRGRVAGYRHGQWYDGPYFAVYGEGGGKGTVAQWQTAMGIDWTDVRKEIAEAIPPAYAEYIGTQLLASLQPSEVAHEDVA